jgi:CxxC motif-containing protein
MDFSAKKAKKVKKNQEICFFSPKSLAIETNFLYNISTITGGRCPFGIEYFLWSVVCLLQKRLPLDWAAF